MILVIGYGTPLRTDDGLGAALVERLAASLPPSDVRTITCHQLTPEIAVEIAESSVNAVLFVDAVDASHDPDIRLAPISCGMDGGSISHASSPEEVLCIARHVYGHCPPAWMLTIPGFSFDIGLSLSSKGQASLEKAEDLLRQFLEGYGYKTNAPSPNSR